MTTTPVTAPTTATNSAAITSLNASPIVRPSAGNGGAGVLLRAQSTITPTVSQATSVLNRLVRIPSNAIVQRVAVVWDAATTTTTGNIGLWFSNGDDGTSVVNKGNLTAISSAFFADTLVMATYYYLPGTGPANVIGLSAPVDVTFANCKGTNYDGVYLPSQSGLPVWQAVYNSLVGLAANAAGAFTSAAGAISVTSDPGGFFDVCMQLTSTGSSANIKMTTFVDYYLAPAV